MISIINNNIKIINNKINNNNNNNNINNNTNIIWNILQNKTFTNTVKIL